jgi:molybdopterin-binding protein
MTMEGQYAGVRVGDIRIWGTGSVEPGQPCRALFRGESVAVLDRRAGTGSLRNRWVGTISEVLGGGRWVELRVDVGGVLVTAVITPGAMDEMELEVGSEVVAAVKASAVRLLTAG